MAVHVQNVAEPGLGDVAPRYVTFAVLPSIFTAVPPAMVMLAPVPKVNVPPDPFSILMPADVPFRVVVPLKS